MAGKTSDHLGQPLYSGVDFLIIDEQDSVRKHIKIFVEGEQVRDLSTPVQPSDEVQIICALSGGYLKCRCGL